MASPSRRIPASPRYGQCWLSMRHSLPRCAEARAAPAGIVQPPARAAPRSPRERTADHFARRARSPHGAPLPLLALNPDTLTVEHVVALPDQPGTGGSDIAFAGVLPAGPPGRLRETRPSRAGDSRSSSAATRSSCAHRRAAHDPPTGAAPADWPAGANAQCPTAPRTCRSSTFPRDQQQKIRLDMRANSGYQPTVTCQTEQAFCRRSVPSGLRQPVGSRRSAQENWTDFWTAAIALGGSDIPASLSASFGRQSCHVCIPATGDCRGD